MIGASVDLSRSVSEDRWSERVEIEEACLCDSVLIGLSTCTSALPVDYNSYPGLQSSGFFSVQKRCLNVFKLLNSISHADRWRQMKA